MADGWTDEELKASVEAYRAMQRDAAAGIPITKKRVYEQLADRFGRTYKAFEFRMQNISSVLDEMGEEWLPGLRPAANVGANVAPRLQALLSVTAARRSPPAPPVKVARRLTLTRLPVDVLEKATPQYIWTAVQALVAGGIDHPFGESTDYDLITDEGQRLPPKAVFGLALKYALGQEVLPGHFTAGVGSPCFRLLTAAGFDVAPKAQSPTTNVQLIIAPERAGWAEGALRLVVHEQRERGAGLAIAKKADFREKHGGTLFCERCGKDPVAEYGTAHAESCIEVHHATTMVHNMQEGHVTSLDDVQCLCANCHRLLHRLLRLGLV